MCMWMDGWMDGRMELEKEREREGETTLNYVDSETTRAGNTAGDEGCERICFAWLASLGRI